MPESGNDSKARAPLIRFAEFEVDLTSRRLHKRDRPVRLQKQPFRILEALLERPGELVTREELQARLWPEDTRVDFDQGLGSAVRKLREALNDHATNPRFVETVSRRGFRFIAPAQREMDSTSANAAPKRAFPVEPRTGAILAAVVLGLVALGVTLVYRSSPSGGRPFRSVVVLPLDNFSEDPEQQYFADGMTEALIHSLTRIDTLDVISRTSAMRYKGSSKSLPEIAQELNVDVVLEGSVLHSGGRVRITTQLIDAERDVHLWSDVFEGADEDVLALQSSVALAVARRMRVTVSPGIESKLRDAARVAPVAYEDFLRGRAFLLQTGTSAYRSAATHFERSIAAEPNYAPAHAGLSQAYSVLGRYDPTPTRGLLDKARASASRAVALDHDLAAAHASLGYVKMNDRDWEGARESFERAISLDSQDEIVLLYYESYLVRMRRFEDARAVLEKARALNPLSAMILTSLARVSLAAHQPDRAAGLCRMTMELEPESFQQHYCLGLAELGRGNYRGAIGAFRQALDLGGGRPPLLTAVLSYSHGMAETSMRPRDSSKSCWNRPMGVTPSPWRSP